MSLFFAKPRLCSSHCILTRWSARLRDPRSRCCLVTYHYIKIKLTTISEISLHKPPGTAHQFKAFGIHMKMIIIAWAIVINCIVTSGEAAAQNAVTTNLQATPADANPLQVSRNVDVQCESLGNPSSYEAAGLRCRLNLTLTVPHAATASYAAAGPEVATAINSQLDVTIEKEYLPEASRLRIFVAPAL